MGQKSNRSDVNECQMSILKNTETIKWSANGLFYGSPFYIYGIDEQRSTRIVWSVIEKIKMKTTDEVPRTAVGGDKVNYFRDEHFQCLRKIKIKCFRTFRNLENI